MKVFYVSFEQEAVLSDWTIEGCMPPAVNAGRLDYGHIVVSEVPWGHEGPGWKPTVIGPLPMEGYEEGFDIMVRFIESLGHKGVTTGTVKGEWVQGIYTPHPSEAISQKRVEVIRGESCFGGNLILSREFFNPETQEYIHLEGHEVGPKGNGLPPTNNLREGQFRVAQWVPGGNDGNGSMDGDIGTAIRAMLAFQPPAGFVEQIIPQELYR